MTNIDTNNLSSALKQFLTDTRAERQRLSEKEKATRKVADCAYKLDRALDRLIEIKDREG